VPKPLLDWREGETEDADQTVTLWRRYAPPRPLRDIPMAFILWRPVTGGDEEYVTGWAAKGGLASYSNKLQDALRYETRAAADAAIAHRTPSEWQVREIADPKRSV
jgi:hypothetical protein